MKEGGIIGEVMATVTQLIICEQDTAFRRFLEHNIRDIIDKQRMDMQLKLVSDDIEEITACLQEKANKKVYIIDTAFRPEVNGFLLAKYIRSIDRSGAIILMTDDILKTSNVFIQKLEILDYIRKTESEECILQIQSDLEYIHNKYKK
ncbi:response regulator [Anaeromicropila herbilytica]|uniref:Stage 0 sporulation protein A homolog n=1 Tax=Anaeromicropila herbilytica TaxID=2785025 RepID=A0A7R7IBQ3_9FIRM|nr:hypothetical protein [Anaeromicropila herbilytica]BCN29883.1 hypothetical protein bsdtb5_11780 [Anaeromicropila herbilytica]